MDAPDLSSMQQDKPNPSEEIQHRLGARAQERFMKETVGTKGSPGSARFLSQRIDEMSSPARVNEQLGRVSGRAQQEFGKQNLWRTAALGRTTGSGAASNALRTGFTGLQSGLTTGDLSTRLNINQAQNKARIGFNKMGEGMEQSVTAGLGQLSQIEGSAAESKIRAGLMAAEQNMQTQAGLMKTGGMVLGGVGEAASATTNSVDAAGKPNGSWEMFGKKLATGFGGGLFKGER